MKKFILILGVALISTYTFAQDVVIMRSAVPADVTRNFDEVYPDARSVNWTQIDDNSYAADFEKDGTRYHVTFDQRGREHVKRIKIKAESLPASTLEYTNSNYPKEEYKEVERIVTRDNKTSYKVRIKDEDFYFDENGNYIKDKEKYRDREVNRKNGTQKDKEKHKEKRKIKDRNN